VSCSNDCATIESYTKLLLESSYGNIPSCSWPNHSSDVVKWSSRGVYKTPSEGVLRTCCDYRRRLLWKHLGTQFTFVDYLLSFRSTT